MKILREILSFFWPYNALPCLFSQGKKVFFVTNNSTLSRQALLKKCQSLGLKASLVCPYVMSLSGHPSWRMARNGVIVDTGSLAHRIITADDAACRMRSMGALMLWLHI